MEKQGLDQQHQNNRQASQQKGRCNIEEDAAINIYLCSPLSWFFSLSSLLKELWIARGVFFAFLHQKINPLTTIFHIITLQFIRFLNPWEAFSMALWCFSSGLLCILLRAKWWLRKWEGWIWMWTAVGVGLGGLDAIMTRLVPRESSATQGRPSAREMMVLIATTTILLLLFRIRWSPKCSRKGW